MTEPEVLEKLASYKELILKLKNEKDELAEINSSIEKEYNDLKDKTYHTIKHLVENVIEKQEAELKKKDDEIFSLVNENTVLKQNNETDKLKRKIEELSKTNINWEEQCNKQAEKISNLILANKQLENKMNSASRIEEAIDELDNVVNEVKIEETHKMIVKPAEKELEELIKNL
jgi:uncharacterized ubiquitin-like protein YukD